MDALTVRRAKAGDPGVDALISTHFALMRASSPEESCHVMPAKALFEEDVIVLAAIADGEVLGVGALKRIAPHHGEIKSMHTNAAVRGRGVARAILRALMSEARDQNLARLSLETGSADMFAPARALYANEGFTECEPFADYSFDPNSVFMTRTV